jgi:hypothetical protein
MSFIVVEYIGDYPIDHQPFWSKRFTSLQEATESAIQLYLRRMAGDWEQDIEAKPRETLEPEDEYYITIQKSNPDDDDAFDDPPVWGIGCIPELTEVNIIHPNSDEIISDPLEWQKKRDNTTLPLNLNGFKRFWATVDEISNVDIVAINGCPEFSSITIRLTSKIGLELKARPCAEDYAEISYSFVEIE